MEVLSNLDLKYLTLHNVVVHITLTRKDVNSKLFAARSRWAAASAVFHCPLPVSVTIHVFNRLCRC
jgi:hypothetical protein